LYSLQVIMNKFSKIFIAFMIVALLNIIPGVVKIQYAQQIQHHLDLIVESNLSEQEGISQIAYYVQRAKSNIRELLLEFNNRPNKHEIEHAHGAVLKSLTGIEKNLRLLLKGTEKGKELRVHEKNEIESSENELHSINKIAKNINEFVQGSHEVLAIVEHPKDAKYYLALFANTLEPSSRTLQNQIDDFKIAEFSEIRQELHSINNHAEDMKEIFFMLTIISFILSVIAGLLFAKKICQLPAS